MSDKTKLDIGEGLWIMVDGLRVWPNMVRSWREDLAAVTAERDALKEHLEDTQHRNGKNIVRAEIAEAEAKTLKADKAILHDIAAKHLEGRERAEAEAKALKADAERYRWLTEDHDDPLVRDKCREILRRMPMMSYAAANAAIDAAIAKEPK